MTEEEIEIGKDGNYFEETVTTTPFCFCFCFRFLRISFYLKIIRDFHFNKSNLFYVLMVFIKIRCYGRHVRRRGFLLRCSFPTRVPNVSL